MHTLPHPYSCTDMRCLLPSALPPPARPPAHSGAHTFFLKQGEVQRWGGYTVNLIHYEDAARLALAALQARRASLLCLLPRLLLFRLGWWAGRAPWNATAAASRSQIRDPPL